MLYERGTLLRNTLMACAYPTSGFGTNAKWKPRPAMSEFGGKAEDIYSG